jgi:[methyl-Co(III) methanol-specific corrinoid protein]:coenzyme M methyltransferase
LQTGTVDLMRLSRARWPEAHHDSVRMADLAFAAHSMAGLEAVRVPFDITVDASAFGALTGLEGIDRQPALLEPIMQTLRGLDEMKVPEPTRDGRAPVVLSALESLSKRTASTPLICGIVGPFMLACQLHGLQASLMDIIQDPAGMRRLLGITTRWATDYARAAIQTGADVITIIDATSSGDLLGPAQYAEFALPYQAEVVNEVLTRGGRSVLHICGDTASNMRLMVRTKAHGISVDQCMDMRWVKEILDGSSALIGNVSPTTTLLFQGPQEVAKEVRACLDSGADVLAPGCGLAPRTPLENLMALIDATVHYGQTDRA